MRKLLFLDDEEFRHKHAYYGEVEVYHAWNVSEFITQLHRFGPFPLYSLDHDLADEHHAGGHINCGCIAAKTLCLLGLVKPELVLVHSYNAPAAKEMVKLLEDAGIEAIWKPYHPKNTPTKTLDPHNLVR
jgi:hypothetical protein